MIPTYNNRFNIFSITKYFDQIKKLKYMLLLSNYFSHGHPPSHVTIDHPSVPSPFTITVNQYPPPPITVPHCFHKPLQTPSLITAYTIPFITTTSTLSHFNPSHHPSFTTCQFTTIIHPSWRFISSHFSTTINPLSSLTTFTIYL